MDSAAATAARVVPLVEAEDSVEIAAASAAAVADSVAEVAAASAPLAGRCSTRFAPNVARKPRFPSSPAVLVPSIAGIVSPPIARHVVAAVAVVVDSAAVAAADSVVAETVAETAVAAATAVPAVTKLHPKPVV